MAGFAEPLHQGSASCRDLDPEEAALAQDPDHRAQVGLLADILDFELKGSS